MKTQVNLYRSEFQPELCLVTLSVSIFAWVMTALLLFAVYFYFSTEQQDKETQFKQLDVKKRQQEKLANALQAELDNLEIDPKLLEDVERIQQLISLKKRVYLELAGQEELKSNGFSTLMLDLAKNHQNGLWLTHINLNGKNVLLEGAANESSIIPKWVDTLGETHYFKGQEFADTRLYRGDDQQLNFVIATDASTSSTEAIANE